MTRWISSAKKRQNGGRVSSRTTIELKLFVFVSPTLSIFGQDKKLKYLHFWTLSDLGLGALLEVSNDVLVGGSEPEGADRLGETGLPPGGGGGHAGGGGLVLPGDVSHLLGQVASVGEPVAPVDVVGCKAAVIVS